MSSDTLFPALLAALSAITGSFLALYSVRRKTSGKINTTEADTLWEQSQQMRKELADQLSSARASLDKMEQEFDQVRSEMLRCQLAANAMKNQLSEARQELEAAQDEIKRLRIDNAVLRQSSQTGGTHA